MRWPVGQRGWCTHVFSLSPIVSVFLPLHAVVSGFRILPFCKAFSLSALLYESRMLLIRNFVLLIQRIGKGFILFYWNNSNNTKWVYCPIENSSMGNWGCFYGECQLQQSRVTQPTMHAGYFPFSITHRTQTWTLIWLTGSLTCAQLLMYAIAYGGLWTP